MKVNISTAAKMVGVDRSTFYRHVEEKTITLDKANPKRPLVDTSELLRVYGDKLKSLEQMQQDNNRKEDSYATPSNTLMEEKIELHVLREKLKNLENLYATEKRVLEDEIELLKTLLEAERAERKSATALLTDQREKSDLENVRLNTIEQSIKMMQENQNLPLLQRIFGTRKA